MGYHWVCNTMPIYYSNIFLKINTIYLKSNEQVQVTFQEILIRSGDWISSSKSPLIAYFPIKERMCTSQRQTED